MTVLEISPESKAQIIEALRAGDLVVLPTDTAYAVFADANNSTAVTALRIARGQDAHTPLPVAVASFDRASGVAQFNDLAADLASALWPGPLTLLLPPTETVTWTIGQRDAAISVRVPAHEFVQAVLAEVGPCVFTNAGKVMSPATMSVAAAQQELGDAVTHYVDHGELTGSVSSVVDASGPHLRLVREGALTLSELRNVVPMIVKSSR